MKKLLIGCMVLCAIAANSQGLFQKYSGNPVFNTGGSTPTWRKDHVANVTVLSPSDTPDGKWRLFLRGSGTVATGFHDQIGMFDQDASGFDPYSGWNEYSNNPNLTHGGSGSYDEWHLLDAAARTGENGNIYLYYMSRNYSNNAGLCGAVSYDGGYTFTKFTSNPMKWHVGPNDMVYHNGQYYIFYGDAKWNGSSFDEKLQIWVSVSSQPDQLSSSPSYAVQVGASGDYDSESVNGAKIFKVSGDSRWFMLYQVSNSHFDYPERFHVAYSYDLLNWTKVNNSQPLMTRGNIGEWDQGGIWTGSVIEHNGNLYLYYEGWGSFNMDYNRDDVYYSGGNSRAGVASTSVSAFLEWVEGDSPVSNIVAGHTYRIVNRNSGKTLEIAGQSTANQADLTQWDYWGGANQHFKVEDVGSGYYRITPMHSNKCLDVYGLSTSNGGEVVQWDYVGSSNQQWSINAEGGDYFSIVNRNSNKGLDVYGWSIANGAEINQWDYLGGENQQWMFYEVSTNQRSVEEVGTDDLMGVKIYPNPTKGFVRVDLGAEFSNAQCKVELFTVSGKLLASMKLKQHLDMDLKQYQEKMVLLKITSPDLIVTRKVILK